MKIHISAVFKCFCLSVCVQFVLRLLVMVCVCVCVVEDSDSCLLSSWSSLPSQLFPPDVITVTPTLPIKPSSSSPRYEPFISINMSFIMFVLSHVPLVCFSDCLWRSPPRPEASVWRTASPSLEETGRVCLCRRSGRVHLRRSAA